MAETASAVHPGLSTAKQIQRLPSHLIVLLPALTAHYLHHLPLLEWTQAHHTFGWNTSQDSRLPSQEQQETMRSFVLLRVAAESPKVAIDFYMSLYSAATSNSLTKGSVDTILTLIHSARVLLPIANFWKGLDIGDSGPTFWAMLNCCVQTLNSMLLLHETDPLPTATYDFSLMPLVEVPIYLLVALHKRMDLGDSIAALGEKEQWVQPITNIVLLTYKYLHGKNSQRSALVIHRFFSTLRAVLALPWSSDYVCTDLDARYNAFQAQHIKGTMGMLESRMGCHPAALRRAMVRLFALLQILTYLAR